MRREGRLESGAQTGSGAQPAGQPMQQSRLRMGGHPPAQAGAARASTRRRVAATHAPVTSMSCVKPRPVPSTADQKRILRSGVCLSRKLYRPTPASEASAPTSLGRAGGGRETGEGQAAWCLVPRANKRRPHTHSTQRGPSGNPTLAAGPATQLFDLGPFFSCTARPPHLICPSTSGVKPSLLVSKNSSAVSAVGVACCEAGERMVQGQRDRASRLGPARRSWHARSGALGMAAETQAQLTS